jgi:hypothetical protein
MLRGLLFRKVNGWWSGNSRRSGAYPPSPGSSRGYTSCRISPSTGSNSTNVTPSGDPVCMHAYMNEYRECILYETLGWHEEMLMLGMVTYTFFKT